MKGETIPDINAHRENFELTQKQIDSKGKNSFEPNARKTQENFISLNPRINQNWATLNESLTEVSNSNSSGRYFNKENQVISRLKSYYGFGPTILCLKEINITLNPQLKYNDLLFMELMVKGTSKKLYTTKIITY